MFQFSRYSGFSEWYFGKAGFYHTLHIPENYYKEFECGEKERRLFGSLVVTEKRHPFYLHFRTPEILWNPQGDLFYPASFDNCETIRRGRVPSRFLSDNSLRKKNSPSFFGGEQGIIDTLIPYKVLTSSNIRTEDKMKYVYLSPVITIISLIDKVFLTFPVYYVHDIVKIFIIPIGFIYYLEETVRDTKTWLAEDPDSDESEKHIDLNEEYEKFLRRKNK